MEKLSNNFKLKYVYLVASINNDIEPLKCFELEFDAENHCKELNLQTKQEYKIIKVPFIPAYEIKGIHKLEDFELPKKLTNRDITGDILYGVNPPEGNLGFNPYDLL